MQSMLLRTFVNLALRRKNCRPPAFLPLPTLPIPTPAHSCTMVTSTATPWRVVVTRKLPAPAIALLQTADPPLDLDMWETDTPMPATELHTRLSAAGGADALLCVLSDKVTTTVLDASPNLKMVSTISVGYNHIDIAACKSRAIPVGNTPDVLTETTADTAVGLVIAACRRFREATASVHGGTWGTWALLGMCGMDVHSSTVGIIGLGRIGAAVARRLRAFNCTILYSGRSEKPALAGPLEATFVSLDDLLARSDIVIPLCPLSSETEGMFNATIFKKMKRTAVFVNAARGELVNQEDLVTALNDGTIFSAGLDVTTPEPIPTDHPLTKCENCFILPHIGSASEKTRENMANIGVRNLIAAYDGVTIPHEV